MNKLVAALKSLVSGDVKKPTLKQLDYDSWAKQVEDYKPRDKDLTTFESRYAQYTSMKFPITIYRAVCIDYDIQDELDTDAIGVHWSTDDDTECAIYDGGEPYILRAKVNEDVIDWIATFKNNLSDFGPFENEITLVEGAEIVIDDVEKNGQYWMKLSFIGNA